MHRRVRWTHYEGVSVYGCPNASSTQGKELGSLAIFSPPLNSLTQAQETSIQLTPKGLVRLASFHPLTPKVGVCMAGQRPALPYIDCDSLPMLQKDLHCSYFGFTNSWICTAQVGSAVSKPIHKPKIDF